MLKFTFYAFMFMCLGDQALAQSDKTKCAAVSQPIMNASDGISSLNSAMLQLDFRAFASEFDGEEAAVLEELGVLRESLLPVQTEFAAKLEQAALIMRRCARS